MKDDEEGGDLDSNGPHFEAVLIGSFALRRGGGEDVTPRARRSRALVAYLILSGSRAIARDRLAALFWSERADEQARASLRQALFELRDLTHENGLLAVSRPDVRLRSSRVTTDLDSMGAAARDGDAAAMAVLYGEAPQPPLLQDLDGISPLFDEWLASQRERCREECRGLALKLCRRTLEEGRLEDAYRLARTLALADPLDEAATIAAMEVAQAAGDLPTVRRLFAALEAALREELGVAPAAATRQAYAKLMDGPPQPLLPVRAVAPREKTPDGEPAAKAAPASAFQPARRILSWPIALAAFAIVGAAVTAMVPSPQARGDADPVVLVEPIAAARDDRAAHVLGAGFSAALARDLVGTGTPVQIVDGTSPSTARPALIMRSNAISSDGHIRANVELTRGPRDAVIWSDQFDRPAAEVDQMVEQISLQVAREVHCAYENGRGEIIANDAETARLALASCDAVGTDFDEATRYAAQAVARAPNFARGWSEYAAGTAVVGMGLPPRAQAAAFARADAYARRAIALNPHQGLAFFALAQTIPGLERWFERNAVVMKGLALDPDNGEINAAHTDDLMQIGRLQDALGFIQHSFAVDHFLPGKVVELADVDADLGDMDGATALLHRGQMMWPHHPWFDALAYKLAFYWGRPEDSLRLLNERRVHGFRLGEKADRAFLAWRAAPSPATRTAAMRAIGAEIAQKGPSAESVQLLAALGQLDAAYRVADRLPRFTNAGGSWYRNYLAPFRADPRFMTLAARLGLAEIWQRSGLWPDFCTDSRLHYDCKKAAGRILSARSASTAVPAYRRL